MKINKDVPPPSKEEVDIIDKFREVYSLEDYKYKQIDRYLRQAGKFHYPGR